MGSFENNNKMYLDQAGVKVLINKIGELNVGIRNDLKEGVRYIGGVETFDDLFTKTPTKGDMYSIAQDDSIAIYNGTKWIHVDTTSMWGGDNF